MRSIRCDAEVMGAKAEDTKQKARIDEEREEEYTRVEEVENQYQFRGLECLNTRKYYRSFGTL
jgi:hypothetical protein